MEHKSKLWLIPNEEFIKIVKRNKCLRNIVGDLGFNKTSGSMASLVKERILELKVDTSHFDPFTRKNLNKHELDDILVKNSKYTNINRLKKRLVSENKLEYKCSTCGNVGIWNGIDLKLQLHHKDGVHDNNSIENLEFLCPNCHSQTENYCGKNAKYSTKTK